MSISSRTPEGYPGECPLCGAKSSLEFSNPGEDAPCPICGCLIWKSTEILEVVANTCAEQLGVDRESITVDSNFINDLGADSLDTVELVMELEEEFDVNIPEDVAERMSTVGDVVRFIHSGE